MNDGRNAIVFNAGNSFLIAATLKPAIKNGLMMRISGVCNLMKSNKASYPEISLIWKLYSENRFKTEVNPLRRMTEFSAITTFMSSLFFIS